MDRFLNPQSESKKGNPAALKKAGKNVKKIYTLTKISFTKRSRCQIILAYDTDSYAIIDISKNFFLESLYIFIPLIFWINNL